MPPMSYADIFELGVALGEELASLLGGTPTQADRTEAAAQLAGVVGIQAWTEILNAISALDDDTTAIREDLTFARADLLAAIDALSDKVDLLAAQLGAPVQTTGAPSWYTAPSAPDLTGIPNAVWSWPLSTYSPYALSGQYGRADSTLAEAISQLSALASYQGYPIPGVSDFKLVARSLANYWTWVGGWSDPNTEVSIPYSLIPTAVEEGDTVLSYLQREQPDFDWVDSGTTPLNNPGVAVSSAQSIYPDVWFVPTFTDSDLAVVYAALHPASGNAPIALPFWPGIAGVALGEPIALTNGLELVGPMDGILVAITGTPSGASRFMFGALSSWRYVGACAFESDHGEVEWPITLGPESYVVTPRTMLTAASVHFRLNVGFTGTVTPWTRVIG